MSIVKWAEREVKLACKRENPDWDGESFDYGCSCYMSALKAFKSLAEDGHSGYSFSITRNILSKLLYDIPLTPITEKDFEEYIDENGEIKKITMSKEPLTHRDYWTLQCPRCTQLFRYEYPDGSV